MSLAEARLEVPSVRELRCEAGVTSVAYNAAGALGVAAGDGTLEIVDAEGTSTPTRAHDGAVLCLALDLDGSGFFTGGDDGRVVRTGVGGGSSTLLERPGRQIEGLAVSRAASSLALAVGREVHLLGADGSTKGVASDHPSTVTGLVFNPRGKRLAVAHYGGVTLWWASMLGTNPTRLTWRGSHIGVTWSPDGTHLVTATQECELHGWRVADGENMAMRSYATKVRSMEWLVKPPTLVTGGADCVIACRFSGGGPQGKPPTLVGQGVGQLVTRVAVHPKGALVAAGFDDGRAVVCALGAELDDRIVRLRAGDGAKVTALAWSPAGTRLAVGTDRGSVSIYDLAL